MLCTQMNVFSSVWKIKVVIVKEFIAKGISKIHVAYLVKGGQRKVLSYGFSSEFTGGIDTFGQRAPSLHAEVACLAKYKEAHQRRSPCLVSVAFSFLGGTWVPAMARPCLNCARTIQRRGIRQIRYSDYQGNLIKVSIDTLLQQAQFSVGYSLQRGMGVLTPKVFLKSETTFDLIQQGKKTVELRQNRGFFSKLIPGKRIQFLVQTEQRIRQLEVVITKVRLFQNFRNLLLKEGLPRCMPNAKTTGEALSWLRHLYKSKFKRHSVLAIHFNLRLITSS